MWLMPDSLQNVTNSVLTNRGPLSVKFISGMPCLLKMALDLEITVADKVFPDGQLQYSSSSDRQ